MFDVRFIEQARRDLTALLAANPDLEHDDVLRMDMVEGSTNAIELLDQLIKAEREALCLSEAIDIEIDRLSKRQARFEHRRTAIRKYIFQLMEEAGLKKVERPAATVSIALGRAKVVITDEGQIPDRYVRIKREPDKDKIRTALLLRDEVPGATLSNAEPQLRIS